MFSFFRPRPVVDPVLLAAQAALRTEALAPESAGTGARGWRIGKNLAGTWEVTYGHGHLPGTYSRDELAELEAQHEAALVEAEAILDRAGLATSRRDGFVTFDDLGLVAIQFAQRA